MTPVGMNHLAMAKNKIGSSLTNYRNNNVKEVDIFQKTYRFAFVKDFISRFFFPYLLMCW